jgi:hypothetical protein
VVKEGHTAIYLNQGISYPPVVNFFAGKRRKFIDHEGMIYHSIDQTRTTHTGRKADMNNFSVPEAVHEIGGDTYNTLALYSSIEFNAIHIYLNANGRTTNSLRRDLTLAALQKSVVWPGAAALRAFGMGI